MIIMSKIILIKYSLNKSYDETCNQARIFKNNFERKVDTILQRGDKYVKKILTTYR